MKQLEIDSEIHAWFAASERLKEAQRELGSAEDNLANKTIGVARRLMPSDAKPGEIYIFPSMDGKAVRCFLKASEAVDEDGAACGRFDPCVEAHDFNRK